MALAFAASSESARPRVLLTYSATRSARGPLNAGAGICIAGPHGSNGRRLTARKDDREPAWSPNGKFLVFSRYVPGGGAISEVLVADARGHVVSNVTRSVRKFQAFNGHPSWSPNGQRIAFDARWYGSAIFIVNRDGTHMQRAIDGGDDPQWMKGGRLAFATDDSHPPDQHSSIYTARLDGSDRKLLIDDASQPALSRDGTRIAFVRRSVIWVADADGGNAKPLMTATSDAEFNPAWSPDGTRLAFGRDRTGPSVVVADAKTGKEIEVVEGPYDAYEPAWRPGVTLPRVSRPACR